MSTVHSLSSKKMRKKTKTLNYNINKIALLCYCILLFLFLNLNESFAFPVATFNIQNFCLKSDSHLNEEAYTIDEIYKLASLMKESKAQLFALQEIRDIRSLECLINCFPAWWKMEFSNAGGKHQLAFIWNKNYFQKKPDTTKQWFSDEIFEYEHNGIIKKSKLFDRPPLEITFFSQKLGTEITFVNVHLKSKTLSMYMNETASNDYNIKKWLAQVKALKYICKPYKIKNIFHPRRNLIFLGDFNRDDQEGDKQIRKLGIQVYKLRNGFSYDKNKQNLDFFGLYNPDDKLKNKVWNVYEVESAIKFKDYGDEIPDHDIIVLSYIN